MKKPLYVLLLLVWVWPFLAYAGGSADQVEIEELKMLSQTDYVLVVRPYPTEHSYSVFGTCLRVEIQGSYSAFHSWLHYPKSVTRKGHETALAFLRGAFEKKARVLLGEMGRGFERYDQKNPCLLKSRALELYEENGIFSIYSYYHGI
jgi:hypothetical protein